MKFRIALKAGDSNGHGLGEERGEYWKLDNACALEASCTKKPVTYVTAQIID